MNNFFDQAFDYLLTDEGRIYTNTPNDSGGPTRYGITQKSYEAFIGKYVSADDIEHLPEGLAKRFYWARYWRPMKCECLDRIPMAICIFDTGVLYGVGTASLMAQKAASLSGATIALDGVIGNESVKALNLVSVPEFLNHFHALILERIAGVISSNPKDEVFRKGWTNRANRVLTMNNIVPVMES